VLVELELVDELELLSDVLELELELESQQNLLLQVISSYNTYILPVK